MIAVNRVFSFNNTLKCMFAAGMVRAKTWPAVQLGQDGGESHKESTGLVCTSSVSLGAGLPTALDPGSGPPSGPR